jgi:predicted heme/steroid binding protein/uncharacterized membrane protein
LPEDLKEFTIEELAEFDGTAGRPVYVAYQGRVYDLGDSALWAGGDHMTSHFAGADLTREFADAPHGEEVFESYPQVGVLRESPKPVEIPETEVPGPPLPGFWHRLVKRFPLLKRHPHPMVVHFPIVFFIAAPIFTLLYLFTGDPSFETTGWHCLAGGVLFTPVALVTGLFTWWLNYELRPLRPIVIKLILTPILLAVGTWVWVWRWLNPEILSAAGLADWTGKVYLGLLLLLLPLVSVIGWYGASLTFPLHPET